jgi:RimJ/RimL family protein N-acetyltransferase
MPNLFSCKIIKSKDKEFIGRKIMNSSVIITQLPERVWQKYREIRLAALKIDPLAFGGTYEQELDMPEEQWREQIHNMWFACYPNNIGQLVGSIVLVQKSDARSAHGAWVYAFWVDPHYRGHGIGAQLIAQVQAVARERGLRKLSLQVTSSQQVAFAVYQKMGFAIVGHFKQELCVDGTYYDVYCMDLFA